MPTPIIDISGKRFGKWIVLALHENRAKKGAQWYCACDCGGFGIRLGSLLRSGESTSCGCYAQNRIGIANKKHGESHSHLYGVWREMRQRCFQKKNPAYKNYGGRGISVCDEWSDFANFSIWAKANGYEEGLTIERKDNNSGYTPKNCSWETRKIQASNRRNVSKRDDGTPWFLIAEKNGIPNNVFHNRRYSGWSDEDAATFKYSPRRR